MHTHVYHLLTAYVHDQLPAKQRNRVRYHVQRCPECRAALYEEQQLVQELSLTMPRIGQPRRNQLMRLWPAIWLEHNRPRGHVDKRFSSFSVALAMMIGVFVASTFFAGPAQAGAAPFALTPAVVKATSTPVTWNGPATATDLPPISETANALNAPMASPAPFAGYVMVNAIR